MPILNATSSPAYSGIGSVQGAAYLQNANGDVQRELTSQLGSLQPGSTVTARYQYQVSADGSLVPLETKITTDNSGNNGTPVYLQALNQNNDGRRRTLADVAKPRVQLSPSDEISLFALRTAEGAPLSEGAVAINYNAPIQGQAVSSDGTSVDVEILARGQTNTQVLNLNAQAQSTVAALYARNNEVAYSQPLSLLAA